MNQQAIQEINNLKLDIKEVTNLEELKQLKAKYTSKSTFFNSLKNEIRTSPNKQVIGEQIKYYSLNLKTIFDQKQEELENQFFLVEKENILLQNKRISLPDGQGIVHPLTEIGNKVMEFFDNQHYQFAHGIEIENETYNFDILNLHADHPARAMQDTFYLTTNNLLRTHSTNVTARELVKLKGNELSAYSVGTVFRNDDNDATHSYQFTQIDIFKTSPIINIANLKWTLNSLLDVIFEKHLETRYRPSYFPFTEPSYEVDIQCPHCNQKGCKVCSQSGWIEILGAGMLHPGVIEKAGKDPKLTQGLAAGIGVERLAMIKWLINDIRNFYQNDLIFLRTYKGENE